MMIEPQQFKVGDLVEERSVHGYTARYIVLETRQFPPTVPGELSVTLPSRRYTPTEKVVYTLYTLWVDSPGRYEQQKPGAIDYLTGDDLNEGKSVKWRKL